MNLFRTMFSVFVYCIFLHVHICKLDYGYRNEFLWMPLYKSSLVFPNHLG